MSTTVHCPTRFDAMPDNPAMTVGANRRELVNRALKAVESMALAGEHNLECLVVIISASFAPSHVTYPPPDLPLLLPPLRRIAAFL